ncbi:Uncharacterised protein [Vibrio cholerae]|nr:Uncharacterised protein [Vibrio cholerae]
MSGNQNPYSHTDDTPENCYQGKLADHGIVVVLFKLLFLAHLHASNV